MAQSVHVVWVVACFSVVNAAPWAFSHFGDPQIGMSEGLGGHGNGIEFDIQRFQTAVRLATEGLSAYIAIVGDLVNVYNNQTQLDGFFSVYPASFTQPVGLIPGNHDVDNSADPADTIVQLEHFRTTFKVHDYSYDIVHNAMFLNIDSTILIHGNPNNVVRAEQDKQWAFIEDTLRKAQTMEEVEHIFLVSHHPPFAEDENDQSGNSWPIEPRRRILALVRQYGVRTLLCGHTHTTEVVQPADSAFTIYIVAGTARFFDRNGFGYRYWLVDGPVLSQRHIMVPTVE